MQPEGGAMPLGQAASEIVGGLAARRHNEPFRGRREGVDEAASLSETRRGR
jgi:hypothetical protein